MKPLTWPCACWSTLMTRYGLSSKPTGASRRCFRWGQSRSAPCTFRFEVKQAAGPSMPLPSTSTSTSKRQFTRARSRGHLKSRLALMPMCRAMTATDAPSCKLCSTRRALKDRSCCWRAASQILIPLSILPTVSCWCAPSPRPASSGQRLSDADRGKMTVLVGLLPMGGRKKALAVVIHLVEQPIRVNRWRPPPDAKHATSTRLRTTQGETSHRAWCRCADDVP